MPITGRCLCGGIAFASDAAPRKVFACHCADCRRQVTGPLMTVMLPKDALRVHDPDGLRRGYAATPGRLRRFCGRCGTVLSWEVEDEAAIFVSLGALDPGHGLTLTRHIFTEDRGGAYALPDDGLPRA